MHPQSTDIACRAHRPTWTLRDYTNRAFSSLTATRGLLHDPRIPFSNVDAAMGER